MGAYRYTLTPDEVYMVRHFAEVKLRVKCYDNTFYTKRTNTEEFEQSYHGHAAEWAFSRMTGLPCIMDVHVGGDGGSDLAMPDGRTVEVRWRGERGWDFALVKSNDDIIGADIGILMWPGDTLDEYEFVGWVTEEDFARLRVRKNLRGPKWLVEHQKLRPPATFFDLLDPTKNMTVYVDPLFVWPSTNTQAHRVGVKHGHQWCHMFCDGPVEALHRLAEKIGLKRSWFQNHEGSNFPHYDLTPPKRTAALQHGAQEATTQQMEDIAKRWKPGGDLHHLLHQSSSPTSLFDDGNTPVRFTIIGTAGRNQDAARMNRNLYRRMVHAALNQILHIPFERRVLISGGAAWADHVAVSLFLMGYSPYLNLHLPAPLREDQPRFVEHPDRRDPGRIANFYHSKFTRATGQPSIAGIQRALTYGGATAKVYDGFFARNRVVGNCDVMLAFTWGPGSQPADGGTANTWNNSRCPKKTHIPLQQLAADPPPDLIVPIA